MGENSAIEWTDHTFNPWIGCTAVSAGCKFCYAEVEDKRRGWTDKGWGPGKPRRRTSAANWKKPLQWNAAAALENRRPKVFCASLADVFDQEAPAVWRSDLFLLIDQCPDLDWLLLTKRPEHALHWFVGSLRPNVWLGVSVEDQKTADERIPLLLETPAVVRFVSYEPALGPVDFTSIQLPDEYKRGVSNMHVNVLTTQDDDHFYNDHAHIDWIIVGGESGAHARPFFLSWAKSTIEECKAAGVAGFVKQLGSRPFGCDGLTWRGLLDPPVPGQEFRCVDRKGGDINEFPVELQVREFPRS